jgi:Putative amidoligase enzyme
MSTIRELFGVSNVTDSMIAERNYKVHPDYVFVNPELLVGLELEIENWNDDFERAFRGFRFETDGSLRNNGIEAITLPMRTKHVPYLLETFFRNKRITGDNYSARCSTHVHVNAQDLTIEQIKSICLIYQTVERVLFSFVGNGRDENIFCVPWHQCNISADFVRKVTGDPNYTFRTWQKYTALNLLPLRDKGTLEFRHLEGTCDVLRITTWVNLLGCVVKFATENNLQDIQDLITNMNTLSNYRSFIERVFGVFAAVLMGTPEYELKLALGVVDTKLCIMNKGKQAIEEVAVPQVEGLNMFVPRQPIARGWPSLGDINSISTVSIDDILRDANTTR